MTAFHVKMEKGGGGRIWTGVGVCIRPSQRVSLLPPSLSVVLPGEGMDPYATYMTPRPEVTTPVI